MQNIIVPSHKINNPNQRNRRPLYEKKSIILGAMFCNESHILEEWIEFHIGIGVDHFILVNNNSTDPYYSIVQKFKKYITLINFSKRNSQMEIFNKIILPRAKQMGDWLILTDLDEFIYPTQGDTLKTVLDNYRQYACLSIPSLLFGSSGFVEQPTKVLPNFLWREKLKGEFNCWCKLIINLSHEIEEITSPHLVRISGGGVVDTYTRKKVRIMKISVTEDEWEKNSYPILINHYKVQSWEWFQKIKMTRGDCRKKEWERVRSKESFRKNDKNEVEDTRILRLVK